MRHQRARDRSSISLSLFLLWVLWVTPTHTREKKGSPSFFSFLVPLDCRQSSIQHSFSCIQFHPICQSALLDLVYIHVYVSVICASCIPTKTVQMSIILLPPASSYTTRSQSVSRKSSTRSSRTTPSSTPSFSSSYPRPARLPAPLRSPPPSGPRPTS